jgi:hypothetical protein
MYKHIQKHTHIHTHTHVHTHTHTHTCAHMHTYTRSHTHTHTHTKTHMCTHTLPPALPYTHAHTHAHAYTHISTHKHTQTCLRIYLVNIFTYSSSRCQLLFCLREFPCAFLLADSLSCNPFLMTHWFTLPYSIHCILPTIRDRVGQNHTFLGAHSVHTYSIFGEQTTIHTVRCTVQINGSGQPYLFPMCFILTMCALPCPMRWGIAWLDP